jgi:hypothetical protein
MGGDHGRFARGYLREDGDYQLAVWAYDKLPACRVSAENAENGITIHETTLRNTDFYFESFSCDFVDRFSALYSTPGCVCNLN